MSMMVNSKRFAAPGAGDPNFAYVTLLMGFEGADASTTMPNEITATNATVTGDAQIDTAQFKYGTSSGLFDGAGDRLTFADSAGWFFGTAAFTVEMWVRPSSVAAGVRQFIGQWENPPSLGWILYQNGAQLGFNMSTTGSTNFADLVGGTLVTGSWQHVCVDFDGTKYRLYLNGAMVASSVTLRSLFDSGLVLAIGGTSLTNGFSYNGWMDEIRITKGVARYASDGGFTSPAAAYPRS